MQYYKIRCGSYTFSASIEETPDMYRVKYGGVKACVHFSVYKKYEEEYPNLDALGSGQECSNDGSLPSKEGTVILLKSSLKFLIWRFPLIRHIQFSDASSIKCANGIIIPLQTFHLAKYGKTWYQDKFNAKPIDKNVSTTLKKLSVKLDKKYNETFEVFYKTYILRHLSHMKGIKNDDLYDMLETCWNEAKNYRNFIQEIASGDCILLQLWLDEYVKSFFSLPLTSLLYWKIQRKTIDEYDVNVEIRESKTIPKYMATGGDGGGGKLFDMNDFMQHGKRKIESSLG
jgi:hypothetical protein